MKMIRTQDAVGMMIGHDLTEIIPGKTKGAAFRKGHVIRQEDIDRLLCMGKEHVYAMEMKEDEIHEDDAAISLGSMVCGPGIEFTPPLEGKVTLKAVRPGLLKINRDLLQAINEQGDICLATIHGNRSIKAGELVGGCRVIPLTFSKRKLELVAEILKNQEPLLQVKPFKPLKAAVIITGSEVHQGLVTDQFGPVVVNKLHPYEAEVISQVIVPDETVIIREAVRDAIGLGATLILVTGGMSVDPDDKTPGAIKQTGATIVTYGTPVLPGAMLMLAYLEGVPVVGLPGCVMVAHTTAFDVLLPRLAAGETITQSDISQLGYGGQCLKCTSCSFPDCHFGKC